MCHNINSTELIKFKYIFYVFNIALLKGSFVCSGIIREKEQQVMDAAAEAGYTLFDRIEKGEWVALALKNEGK